MAADARPAWAERLRTARQARGWTQREAIGAVRAVSGRVLPEDDALLRMWKSWEAGKHRPRIFYQRAIAAALGVDVGVVFDAQLTGAPGSTVVECPDCACRLVVVSDAQAVAA